MPTVFLIVSVIGLLLTLNALRPLPFEATSVPAFFAGWLTSELPIHTIAWQLVAAAVLIAAGALSGLAGWIGLVVTLISWAGLLFLVTQAQRAEAVFEQALVNALGPDYRERMAPELTASQGAAKAWRRLILPFRMKDPDVEKIIDVPYTDDGDRVKAHRLDVYRNRAHPTGRPVFVYIHGGAWVMGDKREQGRPMMLHLAAHGWVCFSVNYRLSPKATWPERLDDVWTALDWIRAHAAAHGGDPSFVAVSGGSAGGHLAALAALTAPAGLVDACVPLYGVYDFTNRDGLRGPGMTRFLLERQVMKVPFASHREAYEAASPMDQIGDRIPPFFVIHGTNDSLVPVQEARNFVRLL